MSKKQGINTKDVKVGGTTPKTIQPGNVKCKINSVRLEEFRFKEGAYNLMLDLETEPITEEGFEGFLVDKDDASKGMYAGQVAAVRAGEWAFADGETKSGREISRDDEIVRFLKSLCISLDALAWLDSQDGKHDTIEDLVDAFSKSGVYKDKYMDFCLGGREYVNKGGYTNFDLFLPKFSRAAAPIVGPGDKGRKLLEYNEGLHLRKRKVEVIEDFGDGENAADKDFTLE